MASSSVLGKPRYHGKQFCPRKAPISWQAVLSSESPDIKAPISWQAVLSSESPDIMASSSVLGKPRYHGKPFCPRQAPISWQAVLSSESPDIMASSSVLGKPRYQSPDIMASRSVLDKPRYQSPDIMASRSVLDKPRYQSPDIMAECVKGTQGEAISRDLNPKPPGLCAGALLLPSCLTFQQRASLSLGPIYLFHVLPH